MKPISYSAAKQEALSVFERFVSLDTDVIDGVHTDDINSHRDKIGKWNGDNKSLLKKFRNSFKRSKLFKSKRHDKENHEDADTSPTPSSVARKKKHNLIKGDNCSTNRNWGPPDKRESSPTFWIIKPPPPLPPPRYFEETHDDDLEVDGGLSNGGPSVRYSSIAYPSSTRNPHRRQTLEFGDLIDEGVLLVDNEDEYDDVDGDGDKFEDVSTEEQERRLDEISRIMNEIVEKEFGHKKESNNLSRSSSSTSIADLGRSLVLDLSYNSFKTQLTSFVRSHNDQLLSQISILFSVARSAMKMAGRDSEIGKEIKNNTLKFYDEQFVPQVSKVGGLDNLLKEKDSEL